MAFFSLAILSMMCLASFVAAGELHSIDPSVITSHNPESKSDDNHMNTGKTGNDSTTLMDIVNQLESIAGSCDDIPKVDMTIFSDQPDDNLVYLQPKAINSPTYNGVGFVKYVRVFGIPIIAADAVTDDELIHGAKIFAQIVDNDGDGVPDDQTAIEAMRNLNTVVGYIANESDSNEIWDEKFHQPQGDAFRQLFVCSIHFFEQWSSEQNKAMHQIKREMEEPIIKAYKGSDKLDAELAALWDPQGDQCKALVESGFDWPVVHLHFAFAYYGIMESIDKEQLSQLALIVTDAKENGYFQGVDGDVDMEIANFIVWAQAARHNLLVCFCNTAEFTEWKLCNRTSLDKFNPTLVPLLDSIKGIPKLPLTDKYNSPAVYTPSNNDITGPTPK